MKVEVLQENLSKGLSIISRVITGKIQMPILGNILLQTFNGQLKLTGTNLEISLETFIGAKILLEGSFTVPARTLTEIVAGLPSGKVILELKDGQLLVSAGKFNAKINGIPAADWPKMTELKLPFEKNGTGIKFDFPKFKSLVSKTIISVGTDEARPALTGLLIKGGKNLTLVSVDGFRLSQTVTNNETEEFNIIVPAKAINELLRMEGKNVEAFVTGNEVVFNLEETILTSRLIAGNFPSYEKIIPNSSENTITFDAQELLKAVKLAGVFARESANIIKLIVRGSELVVKAQAQQTGENENLIDIKNEKPQNEEFTIAFNYHYLLDLLNVAGDYELKFSYSSPLSAGLFQIVGDQSFLHIIMPVRVQS